MDNRTVINTEIEAAPKTAINSELTAQYENTRPSREALDAGDTLCGKYIIERRLKVNSGEADLYRCEHDGNTYVAKLYNRKAAIKDDVANRLLQIDSLYVARPHEFGTQGGFPVEIIPYYKNGSLQGKLCSYEELMLTVIPNINEGLRALHQAGIIHKDLKPSNIMLADDEKTVAIIDFGISSIMSEAGSVVVTKTGMTPEYSAPETFKNLFLEESDYYSFGITLFELFSGYAPYANMSSEEIEQYVSVQRIPFPDSMPPPLRDLISALTYYDITNRKNKSNTNRRWTYDEVKKWLDGDKLVIPGEGAGRAEMPQYIFMNQTFTSSEDLAIAFVQNWEEGKKHLFRGHVTAHYRAFNQEAARYCIEAEEEASRTNGRDDVIFWKLLSRLNPKMKNFCWKGRVYESLPALGRDMLEHLWKRDHSQDKYYKSILSEGLLSEYVLIAAPKNEALKKAAAAIEDSYRIEENERTDFMKTFYLMAYTLSGQKLFNLDGQQFRTVGELAGHMRSKLDDSFGAFEKICHRLVDYDGNLDIQLETWLITIGKKNELDTWHEFMRES